MPQLRVNLDSSNQQQLSRALTLSTGVADTAGIRTETFNGREYTVVPVVAIVEGVLHGANASSPEFAPASEFGKFPKSWDGRPVVMNHPQINGVFVSAAIPNVLEDYSMGMMFNTFLDGDKLKTEAWLDHERINEMGGEALSTLERIQKHELVEVSVGAWIDVQKKNGKFGTKTYSGVWSNVAPDHLALLSAGTPGACSVADGCGAPRLNHAAIGSPIEPTSCCSACDEGKPCEGAALGVQGTEVVGAAEEGEGLSAESEELLMASRRAALIGTLVEGFSVNAVPSGMVFHDVQTLLRQALQEMLNVPRYDIEVMAVTVDTVVYYVWGTNWVFQEIAYAISGDGVVTFTGEPAPVNLLTKILPRQTSQTGVQVNERNGNMSGNSGQGAEAPANDAAAAAAGATGTGTPAAAPAANAEAAPAPTFEALLAAAPANVRESFESGVRMFEARKKALVEKISANERNTFEVSALESMSLETLESIAKMGQIDTFEGRAVPSGQEGIDLNANAQATPKFSSAPANYLGAKDSAAA